MAAFLLRGESRMPAAPPQMIGARQEKSTRLTDIRGAEGLMPPWVVEILPSPEF